MGTSENREEPWAGGPGGRGPPVDPHATILPRLFVMLLLTGLFAEFVIGVGVSVWGPNIPASVSTLFGPGAGSYGWLSVHAVLAVLLVLLGLALVALVGRLHRSRLTFEAVGGFLFLLLAALSGDGFIASSGNALYALFMGIFFLIGWSVYVRLAMQLRHVAHRAMRFQRRSSAAENPPASR
ncbi:MAG: hypothetical protein HKL79_05965 [Thermoplasmata archaeon]|nr:hypothetical protein [Thermoplasmata archaeon]